MLFLLVIISSVSAVKTPPHKDLYVYSSQQFSVRAYQELKTESRGNFLLSPLCLQSLLALKHAGAKGATAEEIAASLFLPTHQVQDVYSAMLASDRNGPSCPINNYHKIFVQEGSHILDEYRRNARERYNSSIQFLNFVGDARVFHHHISSHQNANLENQSFFITSTLTFECPFLLKCPGYSKSRESFYVPERRFKIVEMAEFRGVYNYFESRDLDAKFLELPYKDDECVVTIILPNRIDKLSDLEERLSEVLEQKNYTKRAIAVRLPDFIGQTRIQGKDLLKEMGITRPFDPQTADFSGISETNPIYVSDLFMKASFNLSFPSELSTKALLDLYSGVQPGSCSSNQRTIEFIVDHPYIFMVSVKKSGSILFLGRVVDPEAKFI